MVGDTINISRMSVCRLVHSVSAVLAANAHRDIYLPRNARDINDTKEGFYALAGFPRVVGAIDGSLVPIIAPSDNEPVYVCRKGYHAINVQGIADANLLFTNIVARWPGGSSIQQVTHKDAKCGGESIWGVEDAVPVPPQNHPATFRSGRIDAPMSLSRQHAFTTSVPTRALDHLRISMSQTTRRRRRRPGRRPRGTARRRWSGSWTYCSRTANRDCVQ